MPICCEGHCWGQNSTLNISEKCLYLVEHLLQLLISLGFYCHPPAGLRYCRVTYPETLSYFLELGSVSLCHDLDLIGE